MPPRCTSGLHGRRRHFLPPLCGMACAAEEVAPSAQGRSRCRATRVHVRIDQPCSTARARTLTHTQRKVARCAALHARRRTRTRKTRTAAAIARSRRARMPSSVRAARHRWPRGSLARRAPSARAAGLLYRRVAVGACRRGARPLLGCQGGLLSCARPQPHVGPRYATRRARARAHVVCRRAALHVGVDRCYARRCMVFPLRASCAVPGVVDDFDPMEGSCKIRRFRRGMSHICAGTCAGMCARLRCCGACASI
jgi:hypothetical protein